MKFTLATSCIVEENVSLGDGTQVWYFAHIMQGAKVGMDCTIGEGCFIGKNVMIGNNCKIGNHSQVVEGVVLKDNVRLGLGVVFTNVRKPTVKKSKNKLDTLVCEDVSIGSGAKIEGGVKIGKGAKVGTGAVVISDVPDFAFVAGNPARVKMEKKYER